MTFNTYGDKANPSLLLIPGLGVSYEIFLPLIDILKDQFHIVAAGIDGFLLGKESAFTSVDDQAGQIIEYVQENLGGRLDCAYGLSLGGKILSRMLERDEIVIGHARHPYCHSQNGLWIPFATIRALMSGPVTTGPASGDGCSIPIILMYFWMNAGKCGHTARERRCATDTKTSIPTSWSQFKGPISTSGMEPRRPL